MMALLHWLFPAILTGAIAAIIDLLAECCPFGSEQIKMVTIFVGETFGSGDRNVSIGQYSPVNICHHAI
jgi:hypothetical protein